MIAKVGHTLLLRPYSVLLSQYPIVLVDTKVSADLSAPQVLGSGWGRKVASPTQGPGLTR